VDINNTKRILERLAPQIKNDPELVCLFSKAVDNFVLITGRTVTVPFEEPYYQVNANETFRPSQPSTTVQPIIVEPPRPPEITVVVQPNQAPPTVHTVYVEREPSPIFVHDPIVVTQPVFIPTPMPLPLPRPNFHHYVPPIIVREPPSRPVIVTPAPRPIPVVAVPRPTNGGHVPVGGGHQRPAVPTFTPSRPTYTTPVSRPAPAPSYTRPAPIPPSYSRPAATPTVFRPAPVSTPSRPAPASSGIRQVPGTGVFRR